MKSVGITGQLSGSRADLIVADDVEVPNNSETQGMRDKLSERVKEFDAVLKPGGEVIFLGTPQTEESLYNEMPKRGYSVRVWPARVPEEKEVEKKEKELDRKLSKLGEEAEKKEIPDYAKLLEKMRQAAKKAAKKAKTAAKKAAKKAKTAAKKAAKTAKKAAKKAAKTAKKAAKKAAKAAKQAAKKASKMAKKAGRAARRAAKRAAARAAAAAKKNN